MTRAHALLSASGADRWMQCPPSARLEDDLPESRSEFADEGTFLHNLTEACLGKGLDVAQMCGVSPWEESRFFTKENQDAAQFCIDAVRSAQLELPGAIPFYEQKLDFSHVVTEGFGTGDVCLVGHKVLWGMDHKFGKGIKVDAQGNPQGRLYLVGMLKAFEELGPFETVRFTILQPKLDHVSTEELTVDELMAWAETVKPLAALAFAGEGKFNPGDHCRFCRAKATCSARAKQSELAIIAKFPDPETLPVDELAARLPMLQQAKAWISDVEEHLLKQAAAGIDVPGYKLVNGRSDRKYSDQSEVTKTLLAAGFDYGDITKPIELLGITAMTSVVGKKKFNELLEGLLVKSPGKPTLAPASDKRPAIAATSLAFDDIS